MQSLILVVALLGYLYTLAPFTLWRRELPVPRCSVLLQIPPPQQHLDVERSDCTVHTVLWDYAHVNAYAAIVSIVRGNQSTSTDSAEYAVKDNRITVRVHEEFDLVDKWEALWGAIQIVLEDVLFSEHARDKHIRIAKEMLQAARNIESVIPSSISLDPAVSLLSASESSSTTLKSSSLSALSSIAYLHYILYNSDLGDICMYSGLDHYFAVWIPFFLPVVISILRNKLHR